MGLGDFSVAVGDTLRGDEIPTFPISDQNVNVSVLHVSLFLSIPGKK